MSFILHVNWHIIQPEISSFQKLVNSLNHYLWNGEGVKIGEGININKYGYKCYMYANNANKQKKPNEQEFYICRR
jgi:hypothetical protein